VKWYLDHGCSPNAPVYLGPTAITTACMYAPLDVVRLLVSRGADVTNKDVVAQACIQHNERTPGRLEVVKYVLDLGAPINLCSNVHRESYWSDLAIVLGCKTAL